MALNPLSRDDNPPNDNSPSVFELIFKYLPVGEFAFIIVPLILFGMFTWGLSPDDPLLRQGYYYLLLVIMPAAFFVGNLLSRLSWRRWVFGLLDLASGFLAGLCFLWFFSKVSLVPPTTPVEYIGWNWREWLQFYLLLPLVGVKACRLGMIPNSFSGTEKILIEPRKSFHSSACTSGIITLQFVGVYLLGFWPWFFIFIVFWDMIATWYHLGQKKGNLMDGPRLASKSREHDATPDRFLKIAMPFMIVTQGIFWGLMYTTTMWSQAWLGSFAIAMGVGTALFVLFLKIRGGKLLSGSLSLLPVLIVGCLGTSLAFLLTKWVQPMDMIWSVVNGLSLGGLLITSIKIYSPPKRAFWGPIRMLAFIFLFVLGIGGGIAYFWYDPYGEMYGPMVMLAFVLLAGIFTTISGVKAKVKRSG